MKPSIYWIQGPWPGRLAILARPRGGDWLEDEIAHWHEAGIDVVVSALMHEERASFELDKEHDVVLSQGVEFHEVPIPDRGVPDSIKAMEKLAYTLEKELAHGKKVGIHCRQSIGRSSLIAATVFVVAGFGVSEAFDRIACARGCPVPETSDQKEWVVRFAKTVAAQPAGKTR